MITNSQINFLSQNSRQSSFLDYSQLRINQDSVGATSRNGQNVNISLDATYSYSSRDTSAFSSTSSVATNSGGSRHFVSEQFAQQATSFLVSGQQAVNISRAALGATASSATGGGLSVSAGQYTFISQSQTRMVSATGSIQTSDGENIEFSLSLRQSQSRQYEYSESLRIEERPATDPLVINFGADTAHLTDTLFDFDLDGDGDNESLAQLGSGSGYLVFDRNDNGTVDDGSELFGPQSGSGFGELAQYDDEGNRWIDDNDAIFSQLKVWVQTSDGNEELRSLEEVGVKALYVDNAEDQYTLTSSQGVPLGQIKGTGIYLTTDGEVRTLEEIDLVDQSDTAEVEAPVASGTESAQPSALEVARTETIRAALEKLNEIREQQKAFVEDSHKLEVSESPLLEYFEKLEELQRELLERSRERKQAVSGYRSVAGQ
ncbi:hypothetical protein ACTXGQ_07320 [Marinobacter sp. 1Y8]